MTNPENAIGYGVIVMQDIDEYQGFHIVDMPLLKKMADDMASSATTEGYEPIGVLQSVVAHGFILKSDMHIGAGALGLIKETGHKFFMILATRQAGGFITDMQPLKATNIDDARAEAEMLPEVLAIKARLMEKIAPGGKKPPNFKRN